MLDKKTVKGIVQQYADIIVKELTPLKLSPVDIILYGSHAKGKADSESDIDVAVIYNGFLGNRLKTSAMLWKLRHAVSLDIEPILLDRTQDRSGFVENIYRTGEIIYSADYS